MVEIELIQQGSPDYLREMTSTAPLPHIYFSQAVIFKTTMVMGAYFRLGGINAQKDSNFGKYFVFLKFLELLNKK